MKRILIVLGLLAAVLPPSAARAATLDIDVRSNFFAPAIASPAAGDTVRWTVRNGAHDVVTYAGSMDFASNLMNSSSPPYTQTYTGGDVWYRCTPHSNVNANGVCTGMCASLSDRTAPPVAPTITEPANGSSIPTNNVTFAGSAEPWTVVRLTEEFTTLAEVMANASGAWSTTVSMSGGEHTVAARSVAADGSVSPPSSTNFGIGAPPDTEHPSLTVQSGPIHVGAGGIFVFGEATDNVAVSAVEVSAEQRVIGDDPPSVVAECAMCPAPHVFWSAWLPLPPGAYFVTVTATDTSGNRYAQGRLYAVVVPGPPD